jgi:hypothetical protein
MSAHPAHSLPLHRPSALLRAAFHICAQKSAGSKAKEAPALTPAARDCARDRHPKRLEHPKRLDKALPPA